MKPEQLCPLHRRQEFRQLLLFVLKKIEALSLELKRLVQQLRYTRLIGAIFRLHLTPQLHARLTLASEQHLALLSELPRLETQRRDYQPIKGELPSPLAPPSGCTFHPRCPHAMARCRQEAPVLRALADGHASACHLNDPVVHARAAAEPATTI